MKLTRAQIEAIGTRQPVPSEWLEPMVPLTVAERDALVKLAQGLIALGPEIDKRITVLEEQQAVFATMHVDEDLVLLRQVRAITEGEGTR